MKTTFEDWVSWNYLFSGLYSPFIIDSDQDVGDYGGYKILSKSNSIITVLSYCDLDIKDTHTIYVFRKGETVERIATSVTDNIFNLPYYENNIYYVPLFSDLETEKYGAGAVLPYYAKYYLFSDDDGDNRLYPLNTLLPDGEMINHNHDTVISQDNRKYCNLSTIVEDEYLSYTDAGVDLSNSFIESYSPPLWNIVEPFYIGCKNTIEDKITSDVELTTYINNKTETEYYIPLDYNKDYLNVRLTSKSQFPYLPMDITTQIPIITKEINNVNDLGKYEYSKLVTDFDGHGNITFESAINSRLNLNSHRLKKIDFTVENELNIENGQIMEAKFVNDGVSLLQNVSFTDLTIINNGVLTVSESFVFHTNIINNGELIIKDSYVTLTDEDKDMPFIHNTGTYSLLNNDILSAGEFDNNSVIFIRSGNVDNILANNHFVYDITFDNYHISGNGFIYSNIDDDTIILKNLTSEEIE